MRIVVAAAGLLSSATAALAQEAGVAAAASPVQNFAGLFPLAVIAFIFYFLIIRPQQKRYKDHQAVIANLKKGDMVITGGGKIAKVIKIEDDVLHIELAPGVEVKVLRSTISGLHGATAQAAKPEAKKNAAVKNDNVVPSKEDIANDN